MKKRMTVIVLSLLLVACAVFVTACGGKEQDEGDAVYQIQNGGFETGDLTGWTVESGNAYSDECVVSKTDFGFADDGYTARIAFNHTGNWHLYGRAFDERYESQRVGTLRSGTFTLAGDGTISLKMAGGSLYDKDGNRKPEYAQCFVGVYRASDDRMVARQTNEYFVKHQDGNFDPDKYDPLNGSLSTDNYNRYTIHLEDYLGEQLYIRIVDNDPDFYYGYLSVDDVRTFSEAGPQTEGAVFDKIRLYETEVTVPENDVANGGFETGSLAGWTVTEGTAFDHAGVNASPTWWKENITYNRDGAYHYGFYNPTATGRMRSNTFTLSGSGWVTYKLGGCQDNQKTYIAVMEDMGNGVSRELTRVSNHLFKDIQFPHVPNGLKLANMVQYMLDLSAYLGKDIYFEVVDENTDGNEMGCIVLDSVRAFYESKPQFLDEPAYEVTPELLLPDDAPDSPYQVKNGTFETGDLTDWTVLDNAWTKDEFVISEATWWQGYPYNRKGDYHFATFGDEERTGKMISTPFEIGGSGFFTYLMGGNGGYMAVMELSDPTASPDIERDTELARFYNHGFADYGVDNNVINNISFLANMIAYKADLSRYVGKTVYLLVADEMTTNWAHIELDSIITYYETEPTGVYRPALADKSELQTLVDTMQGVQQGDYDDASWNAFASARATAAEVLRDPRSHVLKIADARSRLQTAYNGLTLKVPTRKDVPLTVEIRKGGSKDVQLLDYVDDNGLALTYTAVCYDNDVTLGTIEGSTLPVSITAQAQSGEILISVLYKGEEKLSFALRITVRDAAFDVAENPAKKYDLCIMREQSVDVDLTAYVKMYESIPLSFGISNVTGAALEGKAVLNGSVLTVSGITASTGTVDVTVGGDGVEKTFTLTVAFIDSQPYRVKNGGFETGDMTDWQILTEGFTGGVISDATYWGEKMPYNQAGNWHLDGWNTGIAEADTWAVRSSTFVLEGTGYISLRMGGNAAAVKVYKANGEQIGYYVQNRFSDTNFPFTGDGAGKGSWADMGTYFIDLHEYIGETLYLELCDVPAAGWAHAFFDEVITYYLELPDIANGYDTVTAPVSKDANDKCIYGEVQFKWQIAQNKL